MRIAFLSVLAEMGGSERSLLELVRGIRRLEPAWTPIVIVPRDGPLAHRVLQTGADVIVVPFPAALARVGEASVRGGAAIARRGATLLAAAGSLATYRRRLAAVLTDLRPDVVHSNGFKLHVLGVRAAPADTAVVWHVHEYLGNRPLTCALLKRHASRVSSVVANSNSVAADLRRVLGPDVSVSTIYNAVDSEEFSIDGPVADLDRLSGLPSAPPGTVRVGLVATFARWKGHATFLRALQLLSSSTRVRGYIVGGALYDTAGSQYTLADLRELASSLGVTARVGFTGFVERPAAVLRALDIVVHASTEPEPFGLVIAEAMACGRAVIVSAAGGAAELAQDGVDALTHTPGDVDALVRAIERCASNPDLRRRLGQAAHQSALERFDTQRFTRAFADLYSTVGAPQNRPLCGSIREFCSRLPHNGGAHGAPRRAERGAGVPASEEPGSGAEPRLGKR